MRRSKALLVLFLGSCIFTVSGTVYCSEKEPETSITKEDAMTIGIAIFHHQDDSIGEALVTCNNIHEDNYSRSICFSSADQKYEKVLNLIYQNLLETDKPLNFAQPDKNTETKEKIKTAQRKWLAFCNAETVAQVGYYGGTITGTIISDARLNMLKERIAELIIYFGVGEE